MEHNLERCIIDSLRIIMYSSAEDGNEDLMEEVSYLGTLLGEYDGVPYDAKHNRLTQAMRLVERGSWYDLVHLNDSKEEDK